MDLFWMLFVAGLVLASALGVAWFHSHRPVRRTPSKIPLRPRVKPQVRMVPFYDFDTRSLIMIPEMELTPGMVRVQIKELDTEAFVDSDHIRFRK